MFGKLLKHEFKATGRTLGPLYGGFAALVLSTHLIGDIENVLDDALFLHSGRVALAGSVDALRAENGKSVDALFREVFKCSGNY